MNSYINLLMLMFLITLSLSLPVEHDEEDENDLFSIKISNTPIYTNFIMIDTKVDDYNIKMPIDISADSIWLKKTSDDTSVEELNKYITKMCKPTLPNKPKKGTLILSDCNLQLDDAPYIELNSSDFICGYRSTFGLAKKFQNADYSILRIIRRSGVRNTFSIRLKKTVPYYKELEGELRIGNHENELNDNTGNRIECDLIDLGTRWATMIQAMIYGDISTEEQSSKGKVYYIESKSKQFKKVDAPMSIETLQKYFIAPKLYFKYFTDKIFNTYIKEGTCSVRENKEMSAFYCSDKVFETFPKIHFVINNYLLTFEGKDLFELVDNEYMFIIVQSTSISQWTFGNILFTKFAVVFSEDVKTLNFISENNVEKIRIIGNYDPKDETEGVTRYEISFGVIFIINIIGIVMLLISLFRQKVFIETEALNKQFKK